MGLLGGDEFGDVGDVSASDEAALGIAPAEEPLQPDGGGESAGPEVAEVDEELVAAVDATSSFLVQPAAPPPPVDLVAAPPADTEPAPPPTGPTFVNDVSLSEFGFVRCNLPGFDPEKVIGFVGYQCDRSNIFASCHLHPQCSVSCGIRRRDAPKQVMAEWLAKGEIVDRSLPRSVRLEATKAHRAA